jgi:uncharacterized protein YndB with AHSA1/START domain
MTEKSSRHDSFTLERVYDAAPARVFAAWASAAAKRRWFAGVDGWLDLEYSLDFRVGGREISRAGPPGGVVHAYEARYYDIVPDARIVFVYDMHLDDKRISVSLTTVELTAEGAGTRLRFTEQGVYLNGYADNGQRQTGSQYLLDALGASLVS